MPRQFALYDSHDWDLTPKEAVKLQRRLAGKVLEVPLERPPRTVAGIDVSIRYGRAYTAVVVLGLPDLQVVDRTRWESVVDFPYVPGLLSFREVPAILPALERLKEMPDVFMLDGQGRAHPRRFGLACHLGILMDRPALGVGKTRLCGTYEEPCEERGCHSPLMDGEETIGRVVRTRTGVKPVFVSVGHRMMLEDAIAITLACAPKYRIPEPTRQAHTISTQ
jgi:deoxyribonuclease V